jgi:hypothetical protein
MVIVVIFAFDLLGIKRFCYRRFSIYETNAFLGNDCEPAKYQSELCCKDIGTSGIFSTSLIQRSHVVTDSKCVTYCCINYDVLEGVRTSVFWQECILGKSFIRLGTGKERNAVITFFFLPIYGEKAVTSPSSYDPIGYVSLGCRLSESASGNKIDKLL